MGEAYKVKKVTPAQLGPVLKGLSELAGKDFGLMLQKLSIDAFRELVIRSARDTGYLRSNWDVTTGSPDEVKLSHDGKGNFASASWPNTKIEAGDSVVLYNNTEYAIYLEHGTPKMRAQPMIEPTRQKVYNQAVKLSKILTKKKYNV